MDCRVKTELKKQFLSYYPLKQGLKLPSAIMITYPFYIFLSYYPLKQGLKLKYIPVPSKTAFIFILLSIKTRIETV